MAFSDLLGADSALRSLVDSASLLAVVLDVEGRVEWVNAHFLELTGYAADEVIGQDWFSFGLDSAAVDEVRGVFSAVLEGEGQHHENPIRRADGTELLVRWNNAARRGPQGEVIGSLSLGVDVTERRAALRHANEVSRELTLQRDALNEHAIVAVTDRRGRITYTNDKFCEISEYTREELLGQDHRLVNSGYHPPGFFRELWATIGRGDVWKGEICNRSKSGRIYWVNTTIVPFRDPEGHVDSYVAIRAEVTQQKEYEESLAQLATIVDSSADAIVREDMLGRITSWNPSSERIYGWTAEEAIGQSVSLFIPVEGLAEERLRRGSPTPFEAKHRTKGGGHVDVSVTIAPILDREGTIIGWARSSRDISERLRIQAQLNRAAKFAALGELAGNVAHEVNNPIGIISGKARLMLSGGYDLPPKVQRELTKIVEQSDRVGRLTQGLLGYCRQSVNPRQPTDIHLPLRKSLQFVESKAQRAGVAIEEDLQEGIPLVQASDHELEQVFLNLFLNALDAMTHGGGKLTIRSRVEDGASGSQELVVRVADTGEGIDPEIVDRIFEPFFTTKAGKGTGLGLAICFGLIHSHDGTLSVASEPGQGTEFSLRLPLGGPTS